MDHHSSPGPASAQVSVIGSGISVNGDIEASVDLHIFGKVTGDVRCAMLLLGPAGEVKGDVFADAIRVAGSIHGRVETRDLAVEAGAHIAGDVTYSRIKISNGGIVDGKFTHRPSDVALAAPALLEPVQERPKRAATQAIYIE
jgi:cytoskeletal protein CcmA (bactofilin family)